MTILVTSDWHLDDKPINRYRHVWQDHLLKQVQKHQVTCVLMLGDLTDGKDRHQARLVNEVITHLGYLATRCPVVILRGNHDYETDPEHTFFRFADQLNFKHPITWINGPQYLDIPELGSNCLFLPHTRDYKTDWGGLDFGEADIIFTHNTFTGAVSESGREMEGIPRNALPLDVEVISGDVHVPQDHPVTYVGAPYTIRFGDKLKPRTLLLTKKTVKSIPYKGPQKKLVVANDIEELRQKMRRCDGDIVKIQLTIDKKEATKWPSIKEEIEQEFRDRVTLCGTIPVVRDERGESATRKYRARKARTDLEVFEDYCVDQGVSNELSKVGKKIVKEG